MSDALMLDAQPRTVVGKHVKYLRQQGLLPAVVYGKETAPISVQIDDRTFNLTYRKAGHTSLVNLQIPGQGELAAFVQDVQRHPVTRTIMHADFRVVDLKVAINAEVPIYLTGTSPLTESGQAVLNQTLAQLEVHALPANIPSYIEVDVTPLDSFERSLTVSEIPTPGDFEVLTDGEEVVVSLTPVRTRVEQEEAEEAEAAAEDDPESIRQEQQEDEESSEES
jgi:large subunit ribosomal protein L25